MSFSKLSSSWKSFSQSRQEKRESQNNASQIPIPTSRRSINIPPKNEEQQLAHDSRVPKRTLSSIFRRSNTTVSDTSNTPQSRSTVNNATELRAKKETVVGHRIQRKPEPRTREPPGSPDSQGVLPHDETQLTIVTSNPTSLTPGPSPTPGSSPLTGTGDGPPAPTGELGDLIFDNMEESRLTSGQFLPEGLLDRFLTESSVRRELTKNSTCANDIDDLVDFAVHRARKIFATLLYASYDGDRLLTAMRYFRRDMIGDDILPITEENRTKIPFLVNNEGPWRRAAESIFCEKQWAFLAPELPPREADEPILRIDGKIPLPFIKAENCAAGAFGEVYRAYPSESNIRLSELKGRCMAVKCLKDQVPKDEPARRKQQEDWIREVETHHKIKRLNHPHIVEFIAAIERGKDRYLVFLWADQGNLLSFWNTHPSRISAPLVKAVITQIQGIAAALDKLHNYNQEPGANAESSFRHGDLKPENILSRSTPDHKPSEYEPDIGTLMISDLGLAKHHNVGTDVRGQTSTRSTTWRYLPPEVLTVEKSQSTGRSRRYDIWSMGCVILEFVIWLRYNTETLRIFNANIIPVTSPGVVINPDFVNAPPWFALVPDQDQPNKAQLHPFVEQTMKFVLENDPEFQGDTALRDILCLVKDRLLVPLVEVGPSSSRQRSGNDAGTEFNSPTAGIPSIRVTSEVEDDLLLAQASGKDEVTYPAGKDMPNSGISIVIDGTEEPSSGKPHKKSSVNMRASSDELNEKLLEILDKGKDRPEYWYSGKPGISLDIHRIKEAATISNPSLRPIAGKTGDSLSPGGRGIAAPSGHGRENVR